MKSRYVLFKQAISVILNATRKQLPHKVSKRQMNPNLPRVRECYWPYVAVQQR